MFNNWLMFADPKMFLADLIVIVLSVTLHEFGHAISADHLGDDTPRRQGRITLWPDRHFDIAGFAMMFLSLNFGRGLGWGRPVEVNFYRLRHPRRDMLITAACGPLMNLILAVIAGLILRLSVASHHDLWLTDASTLSGLSLSGQFVYGFLSINLGLMFFNLIPLHPLDGSKILSSLLPIEQAQRFDRVVGQYSPILIVLIAFVFPQVIGFIIGPPVAAMERILAGAPWA